MRLLNTYFAVLEGAAVACFTGAVVEGSFLDGAEVLVLLGAMALGESVALGLAGAAGLFDGADVFGAAVFFTVATDGDDVFFDNATGVDVALSEVGDFDFIAIGAFDATTVGAFVVGDFVVIFPVGGVVLIAVGDFDFVAIGAFDATTVGALDGDFVVLNGMNECKFMSRHMFCS